VRIGDIAASTAAQSGTTAILTVDATGTVGADTTIRPALASLQGGQLAQGGQILALQAAQTAMTGQIGALFDLAEVNRREIG
ncbi:hypothetical protein, partial [Pseudomonas sp. AH2 (2023)]|uniref:hypothetical protein n=1 Tax=Pseudomonas sp. AH2 (2023) TaxID=3048599 RepID=UPI002B238343